MSLPNIPNITPEISLDKCDTINLLLSSIALEEIGLSHILNAEGEKLQFFLDKNPCNLDDLLTMNNSVNKTLKTIVKSQMLLTLKLEDVVDLAKQSSCYKHSAPCSYKKACQRKHCGCNHGPHCQTSSPCCNCRPNKKQNE